MGARVRQDEVTRDRLWRAALTARDEVTQGYSEYLFGSNCDLDQIEAKDRALDDLELPTTAAFFESYASLTQDFPAQQPSDLMAVEAAHRVAKTALDCWRAAIAAAPAGREVQANDDSVPVPAENRSKRKKPLVRVNIDPGKRVLIEVGSAFLEWNARPPR